MALWKRWNEMEIKDKVCIIGYSVLLVIHVISLAESVMKHLKMRKWRYGK